MSKKIEIENCSELEDDEEILACKWDNLRKITEKQDRIQLGIAGLTKDILYEKSPFSESTQKNTSDKITPEEFREKVEMLTIFDHLNWIQKVIIQTKGDAERTFKRGAEDNFEELVTDWGRVEEKYVD